MNLHRIYGLLLRYYYLFIHSFERLSDAFYWPVIDLLMWGLTGSYFVRSFAGANSNVMFIIISGILFWLIAWRGQYEITVGLLEELWNRNLVNLFVAPLKFSEWVFSFVIIGIIKAIISFSFALLIAFVLYKINVLTFGLYLFPFGALLIMTGWWVGFLVAGIILRYGTKVQTLAWSMIAVLSPFVGIYYPISILPMWAQRISAIIPVTYVFEDGREFIAKGTIDPTKLYISLALNILYIVLSLIYLKKSFNSVLNKGLIKVD